MPIEEITIGVNRNKNKCYQVRGYNFQWEEVRKTKRCGCGGTKCDATLSGIEERDGKIFAMHNDTQNHPPPSTKEKNKKASLSGRKFPYCYESYNAACHQSRCKARLHYCINGKGKVLRRYLQLANMQQKSVEEETEFKSFDEALKKFVEYANCTTDRKNKNRVYFSAKVTADGKHRKTIYVGQTSMKKTRFFLHIRNGRFDQIFKKEQEVPFAFVTDNAGIGVNGKKVNLGKQSVNALEAVLMMELITPAKKTILNARFDSIAIPEHPTLGECFEECVQTICKAASLLYADAVTKWEKRRFYVELKGQEKREKAKKKKAIDMKKAAMSDELLNLAKENKARFADWQGDLAKFEVNEIDEAAQSDREGSVSSVESAIHGTFLAPALASPSLLSDDGLRRKRRHEDQSEDSEEDEEGSSAMAAKRRIFDEIHQTSDEEDSE